MIDPLSKTVLKQEHVSLPALVAVGAIHIGLLWIMLQAAPSLQTSRNVVYQILSPITRLREMVPSAPAVVQRAIQEVRGPIATVNTIQEKKPTERPPEKKPAIAPEALPEVKPVQLAQETVPVVVPAVVIPPPTPVPVPVIPEPAPAPVPVPVPVPVVEPAPAPAPAPARALAITPAEKPPVAANAPTSGAPPGGGPAPSAQAPGGAAGGSGLVYPNYMERRPRQKSFAELANEQLNPGGRKDKFVAAMEGAQTPDCLGTNQTGQVNQEQVSFNGLFAAPAIAAQALQGKCK